MPSGKKSKQMRRAAQVKPPPVQSKGRARGRQASPRVLMAGGGVLAVIIVVVVLAVVLGSGGGGGGVPSDLPKVGSPTSAVALPNSDSVATLFKGIPQRGHVLGKPSAPVTMVEYIDLQCPVCQLFETQVFPDLITKYVRPGKVKVEVRAWSFIGPDSIRGQDATIAAAMQNKEFDFAQLLYYNQGAENSGWLTDKLIGTAAASIGGMNVPKLLDDRNSSTVKGEAATVDKQAKADKVSGTPSLFVGRTGKKLRYVTLANGADEKAITTALDNALAGI
jgi:protein-disulfide isomerase